MTDEQLQQLAALADAATPGPWETISYRWLDHGYDGLDVVTTWGKAIIDPETSPSNADAEFIAASRDAVPELVAEVRRIMEAGRDMQEQRDGWRREAERLRGELEHLRNAIREADTLNELTHMVGPTDAENDMAALRIERIDALYGTFGNDVTKWPESAQVRLAGLQEDQDMFEWRYT